MTLHVGPARPLDCERELREALQAAVGEYAMSEFGSEAAAVSLPDDELEKLLVRAPLTKASPVETIEGVKERQTLHVQVVFDAEAKKRIKSELQRPVIERRVRDAAVVCGGVLGLLALAWGGLKLATRRRASGNPKDESRNTKQIRNTKDQ